MFLLGGVAAGCGVGAALLLRRPRFDWNDKVVLITGGSRGLGLALARSVAQRGARLAICARDEGELRQAESDLRRFTSDVIALPCDVSDASAVKSLMEAIIRHYHQIDVVVNNAGVIQVGPYHTMTLEDFENAMNVIYWGTVHTTLAVLPHMLRRGEGRIVNVTSIGGKVSVPHLLPYSCAKFATVAFVAFSEGLRAELSGSGVKTITIAPGLMRTGSFLKAKFKGDNEREAAWFAAAASLPGISMSAQRAVNQIVAATECGAAERILSLPAQMLGLFHGLFPGLIADILGLVNRALPDGHGDENRPMGPYVLRGKLLESLTVLGQRAANKYLQQVGASRA
jgi:short-subunit dehydrogenase